MGVKQDNLGRALSVQKYLAERKFSTIVNIGGRGLDGILFLENFPELRGVCPVTGSEDKGVDNV